MLGSGVLLGPAPAAAVAGRWLLPGLPLAALTALCCAVASAEQAGSHPDGPGYPTVRAQLGPWPARLAGSAGLAGNAAALAALAGVIGSYLTPAQPVLGGLAALVAVTLLGGVGGRLPVRVSALLAVGVLLVLALVVAACWAVPPPPHVADTDDAGGVVGAAGLAFLGFVGFQRITEPAPGQPRAPRFTVPALVGIALVVQLAVAQAALHQLGSARLALSPTPLRTALLAADGAALVPLVAAAAVLAGLGVLPVALAAARSTVLAMADLGDLPTAFRQHADEPPWRANLLVSGLAVVGLLVLPPAESLGLAACCLLFAHAFGNAAARVRLQGSNSWPMRAACLGLALCVLLAMSMPVPALLGTAAVLAVGTALTGLSARLATRRQPITRPVPRVPDRG
jgi:APA family basic amino acid/polyamine antiporter